MTDDDAMTDDAATHDQKENEAAAIPRNRQVAVEGGHDIVDPRGLSEEDYRQLGQLRSALRGKTIVLGGGTYTAEAREPDRKQRLLEQLKIARRLRVVLENAADEAEARPDLARGVWLRHAEPVSELVSLTEAVQGNYVLDNYRQYYELTRNQSDRDRREEEVAETILMEQLQDIAAERSGVSRPITFPRPQEAADGSSSQPADDNSDAVGTGTTTQSSRATTTKRSKKRPRAPPQADRNTNKVPRSVQLGKMPSVAPPPPNQTLKDEAATKKTGASSFVNEKGDGGSLFLVEGSQAAGVATTEKKAPEPLEEAYYDLLKKPPGKIGKEANSFVLERFDAESAASVPAADESALSELGSAAGESPFLDQKSPAEPDLSMGSMVDVPTWQDGPERIFPPKRVAKRRGVSTNARRCHDCKEFSTSLRRCHFWFMNGHKCGKLYCRICLTTKYGLQEEWELLASDKDWHCPACLGTCECSSCVKERERAMRRVATSDRRAARRSSAGSYVN